MKTIRITLGIVILATLIIGAPIFAYGLKDGLIHLAMALGLFTVVVIAVNLIVKE